MKRALFWTLLIFCFLVSVSQASRKAYWFLSAQSTGTPGRDASYFISKIRESNTLQKIVIYNPNSYSLVNYQVKIDLSSVSNLPSPFKIVNSNNNSVPYCFEQSSGECGTSPTNVVWVKVPNIPANGSTVLYIKAGDSSADGEDVFDFYDDFNRSNLFNGRWVWGHYSDGGLRIVNNALLIEDSGNDNDGEYIKSSVTINTTNKIIETRVRFNGSNGHVDVGICFGTGDGSAYWSNWSRSYCISFGGNPGDRYHRVYSRINNVTSEANGQMYLSYSWSVCTLETKNGCSRCTGGMNSSTCLYKAYNVSNEYIAIGLHGYINSDTLVDWIRVRKYADSEPIVSIQ